MKSVFATLAASLITPAAFAAQPIVCSAHSPGQDNHVEVALYEKSIDYTLHETGFTIAANEFVQNAYTRAVLSKNVLVRSEGVEYTAAVNSLLVYNPKTKTLKLTLHLNDEAPLVETLTCR